MKDTFVTLKTAKLAKEKGCNLYSDNFWFEKEKEWLTTPSQSLLQKWLREKHGIIAIVEFYDYTHWRCTIWNSVIINNPAPNCKTYELALEKGLLEALNLIQSS